MLLSWRSAGAKFWNEDFLKMLDMLKTEVGVWVREKKGGTAQERCDWFIIGKYVPHSLH
jgi:hypothetical protein